MDMIIKNPPNHNDEDVEIEILQTAEYLQAVRKVSDIIKALPLTNEQNDKLIHALAEQNQIGRADAFKQGFSMAYEFCEWCKEHDESEQAEKFPTFPTHKKRTLPS